MSKIIIGSRAKKVHDLLSSMYQSNKYFFEKLIKFFNSENNKTGIYIDDKNNKYIVYSICNDFFSESYNKFSEAYGWLTGGIDNNSITISELDEAIEIYKQLNNLQN